MGNLGLQDTWLDNPRDEEAVSVVRAFGELLATAANEAEDYNDLVDRIAEDPLTNSPLPDDLSLSPLCDRSNMADYLWRGLILFLEEVDDHAGTENEQLFMNIVTDLEEQQLLHKGAGICMSALSYKIKTVEMYSSHLMTEVPSLFDQLIMCGEKSESTPTESDWLNLLRQAGTVLETSLPPVVTLIEFTQPNGEDNSDIGDIREWDFATQVEQVSNFGPLADIIDYRIEYDLRNGAAHGGETRLWRNDCTETWNMKTDHDDRELSTAEFQTRARRVVAASIGLYLFPLYLVSASGVVNILNSS